MRLSGRISRLLRLDLSLVTPTWLSAESPVNRLQPPERGAAKKTTGGSGKSQCESSANAAPKSSSSRTSPDYSPEIFLTPSAKESSAAWKGWVTAVRRASLVRKKLARGTAETGSSSSATRRLWATPTYRDYKGESGSGRQERKAGRGLNTEDTLSNMVASFHYSLQGRMTSTPGWESFPDGRTSPRRSDAETRRLSPDFVEWLMGLPPGWTACGPPGTASSRSAVPWHSALSRILSSREVDACAAEKLFAESSHD